MQRCSVGAQHHITRQVGRQLSGAGWSTKNVSSVGTAKGGLIGEAVATRGMQAAMDPRDWECTRPRPICRDDRKISTQPTAHRSPQQRVKSRQSSYRIDRVRGRV